MLATLDLSFALAFLTGSCVIGGSRAMLIIVFRVASIRIEGYSLLLVIALLIFLSLINGRESIFGDCVVEEGFFEYLRAGESFWYAHVS